MMIWYNKKEGGGISNIMKVSADKRLFLVFEG